MTELAPLYVVSRCIPPAQAGGGRRALRQAQYWAAEGRDVTVLTSTPRQEPVPGVALQTIDLAGWYAGRTGGLGVAKNLRLLWRLFCALGRPGQPVVYCMGGSSWFVLLAILAAKLRGLKVVVEPGTMGSGDPAALREGKLGAVKLALFDMADAVVNLSPAAARRCDAAGIRAEKQHLIPNSVNTAAFAPPAPEEKERLRAKLGLGGFDTVLLSVGAVRPRKDTKALVEMLGRVAAEHPGCGLVLAGPLEKDAENARYAGEVKRMVEERGLEERVRFPGAVSNVEEWMKASNAFVFASRREGFGTVVIEAMSTGLPVVAMEIPDVTRFIFEDGEGGYIASTPDAFAGAVQKVLAAGPAEREAMGRRARQAALERFSDDAVMHQYLALFDQLKAGTLREGASYEGASCKGASRDEVLAGK